jgi:hypothetical protein
MGFLHLLLPGPQLSESMLISCGVDNKFVLLQNVLVDQVSREYYYTKLIINNAIYLSCCIVFLWDMFLLVVYPS